MSEKAENKQKEAVAYGLTNNALTQAASNVSRITYSNYNYTIVTTLYITFMYIGSRYLPSLNYLEEQSEGVKGWLKSCFKIDFKIKKKIIDEHFTYIHSVIVFFVRNRPPSIKIGQIFNPSWIEFRTPGGGGPYHLSSMDDRQQCPIPSNPEILVKSIQQGKLLCLSWQSNCF